MKENIFRKESLEKIESPDELDKYVKITNPRIWILLIAIVLLLIGACIWGFCGELNTIVKGACKSEDGIQRCIINESDAKKLAIGDRVKIADDEGIVTNIELLPAKYGEVAEKLGAIASKEESNDEVREFEAKTDIPDGNYYLEVIVETKAPFAFVFNY